MRSYRGDIEALVPQLRQFARALVIDHRPDIADDLVHDALTHALRAEQSWTGEDLSVGLYTRLIGSNRLRLRAGLGERRSAPAALVHAEAKPAGGSGYARRPGQSADGLDALSLDDRETLLLVVLCRLDYARVAEVSGVPIGTVVSRLSRARDRLGSSLWATAAGKAAAIRPPRPRQPTHLRLVKS